MADTRGQIFTLEGFMAALVVLSSVVFALTTTAATPLSASTANKHLETQQETAAASLLDVSTADGSLRATLLNWNDTRGRFNDADTPGYYLSCNTSTAFGRQLEYAFERRGSAFNVNIRYVATNGVIRTERLVYVGEPSDNAVRVSTIVTLYDDDVLYADGTPSNETLSDPDVFFYAPDVSDGPLYNVLEVEVVTWRV